jgi:hypothetical protein
MIALGQSENLALAASKYLRVLIPSLWVLAFTICIQNWLHAQSKTRAIAVITFMVNNMKPNPNPKPKPKPKLKPKRKPKPERIIFMLNSSKLHQINESSNLVTSNERKITIYFNKIIL